MVCTNVLRLVYDIGLRYYVVIAGLIVGTTLVSKLIMTYLPNSDVGSR